MKSQFIAALLLAAAGQAYADATEEPSVEPFDSAESAPWSGSVYTLAIAKPLEFIWEVSAEPASEIPAEPAPETVAVEPPAESLVDPLPGEWPPAKPINITWEPGTEPVESLVDPLPDEIVTLLKPTPDEVAVGEPAEQPAEAAPEPGTDPAESLVDPLPDEIVTLLEPTPEEVAVEKLEEQPAEATSEPATDPSEGPAEPTPEEVAVEEPAEPPVESTDPGAEPAKEGELVFTTVPIDPIELHPIDPIWEPWTTWGGGWAICSCVTMSYISMEFTVMEFKAAEVFPLAILNAEPVFTPPFLRYASAGSANPSAVPEPSGIALIGLGLAALRLGRRQASR